MFPLQAENHACLGVQNQCPPSRTATLNSLVRCLVGWREGHSGATGRLTSGHGASRSHASSSHASSSHASSSHGSRRDASSLSDASGCRGRSRWRHNTHNHGNITTTAGACKMWFKSYSNCTTRAEPAGSEGSGTPSETYVFVLCGCVLHLWRANCWAVPSLHAELDRIGLQSWSWNCFRHDNNFSPQTYWFRLADKKVHAKVITTDDLVWSDHKTVGPVITLRSPLGRSRGVGGGDHRIFSALTCPTPLMPHNHWQFCDDQGWSLQPLALAVATHLQRSAFLFAGSPRTAESETRFREGQILLQTGGALRRSVGEDWALPGPAAEFPGADENGLPPWDPQLQYEMRLWGVQYVEEEGGRDPARSAWCPPGGSGGTDGQIPGW